MAASDDSSGSMAETKDSNEGGKQHAPSAEQVMRCERAHVSVHLEIWLFAVVCSFRTVKKTLDVVG